MPLSTTMAGGPVVPRRLATPEEEAYLQMLEQEERALVECLASPWSEVLEEPYASHTLEGNHWYREAPWERAYQRRTQLGVSDCAELLHRGADLITDAGQLENLDPELLLGMKLASHKLEQAIDAALLNSLDRKRDALIQSFRWNEVRSRDLKRKWDVAEENCRQLRRKLEEAKEQTLCIICFEKDRNVVILPCMHFTSCADCLERLRRTQSQCPICRTPISGVLKCCLSRS